MVNVSNVNWSFHEWIFKIYRSSHQRYHCMKSVQIRIYFWSVFPYIQSEYSKIRTRNNSVFGHFLRGVSYKRSCSLKFRKFHWKLTKFLKTYFEEHLGTAASKFRILRSRSESCFCSWHCAIYEWFITLGFVSKIWKTEL